MPTEPSVTFVVLELVGIFVFAISGAVVAVRKGLDAFGVLVARQRLRSVRKVRSVAEQAAQVVVGEDAVGVEPVAQREEVTKTRVEAAQLGNT